MVLIKFILLYFSIIISKHLISCEEDDADADALATTSNDLVFDLKNLKVEDYTINESTDTIIRYKFTPKSPKIISEVKLIDGPVWNKKEEGTIVDVLVYVTDKLPHTYVLDINDKTNSVHSLHFHYFNTLRSIGMIAFLYLKHNSLLTTYNKDFYVFNLKNPFDYKYHQTEIFNSGDSTIKNLIVTPRKGLFIDIYDNLTKILNVDKPVDEITLSKKDGKDVLLKLRVKDDEDTTTYSYYKYVEDAWYLIDDAQYNSLYGTNNFKSATDSNNIKIVGNIADFDINDTKDLSGSDVKVSYGNFMLIPAIVYKFKELSSLSDSKNQIFRDKIYNAEVYIFRNLQDYEMIEVTHTSSGEHRIRKPNCYFIKEEQNWRPTKQGAAVQKLMEQTVLTLREKGAGPELIKTIESLHLAETPVEVEKENLDIEATFTIPDILKVDPSADADPWAGNGQDAAAAAAAASPGTNPDDPLKPKVPGSADPASQNVDTTAGEAAGASGNVNGGGGGSGNSDDARSTDPPKDINIDDPLKPKIPGSGDTSGQKPPNNPPTGGEGSQQNNKVILPGMKPEDLGPDGKPKIPGSTNAKNTNLTGDQKPTNATTKSPGNKDNKTNKDKKKGDFLTSSIPIISSFLFFIIY